MMSCFPLRRFDQVLFFKFVLTFCNPSSTILAPDLTASLPIPLTNLFKAVSLLSSPLNKPCVFSLFNLSSRDTLTGILLLFASRFNVDLGENPQESNSAP